MDLLGAPFPLSKSREHSRLIFKSIYRIRNFWGSVFRSSKFELWPNFKLAVSNCRMERPKSLRIAFNFSLKFRLIRHSSPRMFIGWRKTSECRTGSSGLNWAAVLPKFLQRIARDFAVREQLELTLDFLITHQVSIASGYSVWRSSRQVSNRKV